MHQEASEPGKTTGLVKVVIYVRISVSKCRLRHWLNCLLNLLLKYVLPKASSSAAAEGKASVNSICSTDWGILYVKYQHKPKQSKTRKKTEQKRATWDLFLCINKEMDFDLFKNEQVKNLSSTLPPHCHSLNSIFRAKQRKYYCSLQY